MKENPDNRYREEIMYQPVVSNYKYASQSVKAKQKERYLAFVDEYYNFVSEFPESKYKKTKPGMFEHSQTVINNK